MAWILYAASIACLAAAAPTFEGSLLVTGLGLLFAAIAKAIKDF